MMILNVLNIAIFGWLSGWSAADGKTKQAVAWAIGAVAFSVAVVGGKP